MSSSNITNVLVAALGSKLVDTAAQQFIGSDHPLAPVAKDITRAAVEEVTGIKITSSQAVDDAMMSLLQDESKSADFHRVLNERIACVLAAENEWIKHRENAAANARKIALEYGDKTPERLAWAIMAFLALNQLALFSELMPTDEAAKAAVLKGTSLIELAVGVIFGYFFGSSTGSKMKDYIFGSKR